MRRAILAASLLPLLVACGDLRTLDGPGNPSSSSGGSGSSSSGSGSGGASGSSSSSGSSSGGTSCTEGVGCVANAHTLTQLAAISSDAIGQTSSGLGALTM